MGSDLTPLNGFTSPNFKITLEAGEQILDYYRSGTQKQDSGLNTLRWPAKWVIPSENWS